MNFSSANPLRSGDRKGEGDKTFSKDSDRFAFRSRVPELADSGADRFRDGRSNTYRRRGQSEQDSEGWSTVKPRKSFGHEGAERFHGGRMGGGDRYTKEERRPRDRDDADGGRERTRRNFDHHRDKDGDEGETPRRNGLTRGKSEPWFKDSAVSDERQERQDRQERTDRQAQRERIDRAKSWRERDPDAPPGDSHRDRGGDRSHRYEKGDRDHRAERDPEWMDEPAGEKAGGHTEEDFRKFMERMKASKPKADDKGELSGANPFFMGMEKPKVESAPAVEMGPDRFFEKFKQQAVSEETSAAADVKTDKSKAGKSSRFTSFFSAQQEDTRRQTEPPTPAIAAPPQLPPQNGLASLASADREAFHMNVIQKLRGSAQATTPTNSSGFSEPPTRQLQEMRLDARPAGNMVSPEPFQQYARNQREDPRLRGGPLQPTLQDLIASGQLSQPPNPRGEQQLLPQEILAQRQQAATQGAASRQGPAAHAALDPERQFLMTLMQSHRDAPPAPRTEELLVRMPQPQKQISVPEPTPDLDFVRDQQQQRSTAQQQRQMRGPPPPHGLFEDQFRHPDENRAPPPPQQQQQQQPTAILQRPPPPGLHEPQQPMHPGFLPPRQGGGPPGGMIPPPGLQANPGRPMPGHFPHNFQPGPGPFPGPQDMAVPGGPPPGPPRNMGPPPGFYPGPPGFMAPPPGMPPFQGGPPPGPGPLEGMSFPFDGRGMGPPPGAPGFRR
jgi:hypothetical protein